MNMQSTLPPNLTPETFCLLADRLTVVIRSLKGDAESGFGFGVGVGVPIDEDYGYSRAVREYEAELLGVAHFPTTHRLLPNVHQKTTRGGDQLISDFIYQLLQDLSHVCASADVRPRPMSIAGYATHFNTGAGGPWNALVSEELANAIRIWHRGLKFSPTNVFSPEILFMGGRTFGDASITAGDSVDTERFAGVRPAVYVTGYAGDPGVVTVSGAARTKHGGVIAEGRTWSWAVETDGVYELVPDTEGDLCLAVRAIGLPAGMAGGRVTVKGLGPARFA